MHDVTLGATGTSDGHDRHPKIGAGAWTGARLKARRRARGREG